MGKRFGRASLFIIVGLALVWALAVANGLTRLADYANTSGEVGRVLSDWPKESSLPPRSGTRSALLLFLHPKCPCSRASVAELDGLMARVHGRADVYTIFVQPPGWSESAVKGALWRQATSIPGVVPFVDADGAEAKRFGAQVSGHLFAFSSAGRLAFSGGITPSRGHQGDNPGREAAVAFVNEGRLPLKKTAVFGCSLFSAHEKIGREG